MNESIFIPARSAFLRMPLNRQFSQECLFTALSEACSVIVFKKPSDYSYSPIPHLISYDIYTFELS